MTITIVTGTDVVAPIIETAPQYLALLIGAALLIARRRQLSQLFQQITRVRFGPVEAEFDLGALRDARPEVSIDNHELSTLEQRLARNRDTVAGLRILWVDDTPRNNSREREVLRNVGATIVNVSSTEDALRALDTDDYDLIITDQDRPESRTAGSDLVAEIRRRGFETPAIAYVGSVDPHLGTPAHFHAFTDRPDDLTHAVLDVSERLLS